MRSRTRGSLRRARLPRRDSSLDSIGEDGHLLAGLLVALALRHCDALAIGRESFLVAAVVAERAPEQLPGRGVIGIDLDRAPQMQRRFGCMAGFHVPVTEGEAQ